MKTSAKIILGVVMSILVILIIYIATGSSRTIDTENMPNDSLVVDTDTRTEPVTGCYVATLGQDVYSLNIIDQQGMDVSGTLVFDNYEKDSSSGTLVGTYDNGILLGMYSFFSEGMDSVVQVIFQQTEDGFQRGFGPMDETGTQFADLNDITYDTQYEFVKTDSECPEPWTNPTL